MRWLIDGYNVIRRDPDLRAHEAESLQAGRTALLRLVADAARAGGDRFTVVFDGALAAGPAGAGGQVEVTFSRPPETADGVRPRPVDWTSSKISPGVTDHGGDVTAFEAEEKVRLWDHVTFVFARRDGFVNPLMHAEPACYEH